MERFNALANSVWEAFAGGAREIAAFIDADLELWALGAVIILLVRHFFVKERVTSVQLAHVIAMLVLAGIAFVSFFLSAEKIDLKSLALLLFGYGVALYVGLCEMLLRGLSQYKLDVVTGRFSRADVLAPLVVTTAIVIRFVKTRAEINEWNKVRKQV
jgi:hypothetical protein